MWWWESREAEGRRGETLFGYILSVTQAKVNVILSFQAYWLVGVSFLSIIFFFLLG